MEIDKIIQDYISVYRTDYAIMIDGEWGTGKTFYWKNKLVPMINLSRIPKEKNEDDARGNYEAITVSLFGVDSVQTLKRRIFEEIAPVFKNKILKTTFQLTGLGINKALSFFNIDGINKNEVDSIVGNISVDLSKYVLCFDDLERLNHDLLIELLGYINTLIEQENIKVVFLCNDTELHCHEDYRRYKEKIVRFSHKISPNIYDMVIELAKSEDAAYSEFLTKKASYINSMYRMGGCSNLRTLKFNIDVFRKVFDTTRVEVGADYDDSVWYFMLLLSIMYCIEYRTNNDKRSIYLLLQLTQGYANQINLFTSLDCQHGVYNEKKEIATEKSQSEKDCDYIKATRDKYFRNTLIYGSCKPMIDYITTGVYNETGIRQSIVNFVQESLRYRESPERQLLHKIMDFWSTNDDEMDNAVKTLIDCFRDATLPLSMYPTAYYHLQRLQKFGFADLGVSEQQLKTLALDALERCKKTVYEPEMESNYRMMDSPTPEFKEIADKATEINFSLNKDANLIKFESIVTDPASTEELRQFSGLCFNIFTHIEPDDFFGTFLMMSSRRKCDYWNFFKDRYEFPGQINYDKKFIEGLMPIMEVYLKSDKKPSPSKVICRRIYEILSSKLPQEDDLVG